MAVLEVKAVEALVALSHPQPYDTLFNALFSKEASDYIKERDPEKHQRLKNDLQRLDIGVVNVIDGVYAVSTGTEFEIVFVPSTDCRCVWHTASTANKYYRNILPPEDHKKTFFCSVIRLSRTGPVMSYYPPPHQPDFDPTTEAMLSSLQCKSHGWDVVDGYLEPGAFGVVTVSYDPITHSFVRVVSSNVELYTEQGDCPPNTHAKRSHCEDTFARHVFGINNLLI